MINVAVAGSIGALDLAGKLDAGASKGLATPRGGTPVRVAEGEIVSGDASAGYRVVLRGDNGELIPTAVLDCVFPVPEGASLAVGRHVFVVWKSTSASPKAMVGGGGSEVPVIVSALGFVG